VRKPKLIALLDISLTEKELAASLAASWACSWSSCALRARSENVEPHMMDDDEDHCRTWKQPGTQGRTIATGREG
jgi:hypothetical protein